MDIPSLGHYVADCEYVRVPGHVELLGDGQRASPGVNVLAKVPLQQSCVRAGSRAHVNHVRIDSAPVSQRAAYAVVEAQRMLLNPSITSKNSFLCSIFS
jgi:hypothetical protein